MRYNIFPLAGVLLLTVIFMGCREDSIQSTNKQEVPQFAGQVTSHTDCKTFLKAGSVADSTDSSSCIEYSFDAGKNKLILKHINAGFNCCPESLYCLISLRNDTIFFEEHEKIAGCHCSCLFDLDMEIDGIVAKKYFFIFIEPYCGEQEKLCFEVDLSAATQGNFCVKRIDSPWGV